ncbi:MAG: hypothetical protein H7X70_04665 [Candidatus Kapabacteria bacterium]|nr:hypothetical protein [Candidatus Kapabacteria bacterium]
MIWRILIVVGILAILVGGATWINDGMQIYSKDHNEVVTMVKDDLFGTTRREVSYEPDFKFGLLPLDKTVASTPACYGFVLGVSIVLIGLGWWKIRRKV